MIIKFMSGVRVELPDDTPEDVLQRVARAVAKATRPKQSFLEAMRRIIVKILDKRPSMEEINP